MSTQKAYAFVSGHFEYKSFHFDKTEFCKALIDLIKTFTQDPVKVQWICLLSTIAALKGKILFKGDNTWGVRIYLECNLDLKGKWNLPRVEVIKEDYCSTGSPFMSQVCGWLAVNIKNGSRPFLRKKHYSPDYREDHHSDISLGEFLRQAGLGGMIP
ncbi:hypothetical protein [La Joya virus]|uniref:Uncharacterized protein n=1 Tax=La Joya virus TaxID=1272946 RepID=A0A0D3R0X7_9RHAB|nr:hypothetical protein [La Joya virus]AJR28304.1 hypothetical protein [La Joya virus]